MDYIFTPGLEFYAMWRQLTVNNMYLLVNH